MEFQSGWLLTDAEEHNISYSSRWLIGLALSAICLTSYADTYGHVFVDEVVRVYDGDTITVNVNQWPDILGQEIGVRVRGVDTPEIRGDCETEERRAREARDFVSHVLEGAESVVLRDVDRGKYFRVVADVMVDGRPLDELLVNNGLGRPYQGGHRNGWCGE